MFFSRIHHGKSYEMTRPTYACWASDKMPSKENVTLQNGCENKLTFQVYTEGEYCVFIHIFLAIFPLKLTVLHTSPRPTKVVGGSARVRASSQWTGALSIGPIKELEKQSGLEGLQLRSGGEGSADSNSPEKSCNAQQWRHPCLGVTYILMWHYFKSFLPSNDLKVTADSIWASASCQQIQTPFDPRLRNYCISVLHLLMNFY